MNDEDVTRLALIFVLILLLYINASIQYVVNFKMGGIWE